MAVDGTYVRQLAVALTSLARNTDLQCRVHVVHDGIAIADRDRVCAPLPQSVQVEWVDPAAIVRHRLPTDGPPDATFYRFFLPELLSGELERVLYLDADVIVRRPLTELWTTDIADAPIGAVRDAYMPWMARDLGLGWRQLELAPESAFFNSGVMLISLDVWRQRQLGDRAATLVATSSAQDDQAALNVVLVDEWAALHPTWNLQSYHLTGDTSLAFAAEGRERMDVALADPAIVHFTGGSFNRPWQAPCRNPYRDEWLERLDETAWAGWRPKPAPRLERSLGRARRAFRVLRHGGSGADP